MHSVKSLRTFNPDMKVALFTNKKITPNEYFDFIFPVDTSIHPIQGKVLAMVNTPFEETLYLDVDTEITDSLRPLFENLKRDEIYVAYEPNLDYTKRPPEFHGFKGKNIINTGLILFKQSSFTNSLVAEWKNEMLQVDKNTIKLGELDDQTIFNRIIENKLTLGFLDNSKYNVRYWAYKNMDEDMKNEIIVKHWHFMNRTFLSIKLEEYYCFMLRKLLGIHREQIR